jgi:hypothetical protein
VREQTPTRLAIETLAETAVAAKRLVLDDKAPSAELLLKSKKLAAKLQSAPLYLRPAPQMSLVTSAGDCLKIAELSINWAVERLYGIEGLGPFNEF